MPAKPKITIVGPGRLGTALATALKQAGYSIDEIISRNSSASKAKARKLARTVGARASTTTTARLDAPLIWFCVPDRQIAQASRELASAANWEGKVALHSSGALASEELRVLRRRGAAVASVHPMMTFVSRVVPSLRGVPFALEGDAAALRQARRLVRALGGHSFAVRKRDKLAYHAWATFASPLLVAVLVAAEQAARTAGFSAATARRNMLPIVKQTVENYARLGPANAFSGPLVRGDATVVAQHLRALKKLPEIRDAYLALARIAIRHLQVKNRRMMFEVLR
jgi:predicted short-subunit dehydrogenase-like oxidoreductase (DUF2520 family)